MFGYVTINKPELKIKDYDKYQSYYCGLCRILKQRHGFMGQVTLTYDMTFLIILLSGLYEPAEEITIYRCPYNPLKKCNVTISEITEYGADMNILLAYYNLLDDWDDERNLLKKSASLLLENKCKQVINKYERQASVIKNSLEKLHQCEKNMEKDMDFVAGLMGEMLGEIFVYKQDEWEEHLRKMGFYLGKFIYLMDAYEDRKKDSKKGSYNPFYNLEKELSERDILFILNMMVTDCAKEFEMLPIIHNVEILRNIIYAGVWLKFDQIQKAENLHNEVKK